MQNITHDGIFHFQYRKHLLSLDQIYVFKGTHISFSEEQGCQMLVMGPVSYNQIQQLFQPLEYIHRKYQNRIVQRINDSLEYSYQGVEKLYEVARQRHNGGPVDKIYLQNIMKIQQQIDVIHYQLLLSFKEFARDVQIT